MCFCVCGHYLGEPGVDVGVVEKGGMCGDVGEVIVEEGEVVNLKEFWGVEEVILLRESGDGVRPCRFLLF